MADGTEEFVIEGSDDAIMGELLSFAGVYDAYPDCDFAAISMADVISAGIEAFDWYFDSEFDADRPAASDYYHKFITTDPENAKAKLREELRPIFE